MRYVLFFLFVIPWHSWAQQKPGTNLFVSKATGRITVDGKLDEPDWQTAKPAADFFQNYPADSIPSAYPTIARVTFDEHHLYVAFVCYDDQKPPIVQSLRRDFDLSLNDNVGIYIDPYNDYTNGFYFAITPFGVQAEGLLYDGASSDDALSPNWDNKWFSAVTRYDDRWEAELSIPFKSFRYNDKVDWNISFVRFHAKHNEISSWIATPIQFYPASLAYSGKLQWQEAPPKAGMNVSLIPFITGATSKDEEANTPADVSSDAGFDAKVGLTPALNLDLTVNSDFSQVEVDRQVINLTRFEFGFPERRQFFLENNDLFSQPGFPDSRPFFSRRIGLIRDTSEVLRQVPILFGARISGKLGSDWRIGLMNMQTKKQNDLGLPSQNYSVVVLQRQIFSRSNIGFVLVNKQSLGLGEYDENTFYHPSVVRSEVINNDTINRLNTYNRVFGFDFNLNSKDNRWRGDIYYHRSLDAFNQDENFSYGFFLGYYTKHLNVNIGQQGMGQNFNAETGFTPTLNAYPGFYNGFLGVTGILFPASKTIANMGPSINFNYNFIPNGSLTDWSYRINYRFRFLNTSAITVSYNRVFQQLVYDFNPVGRAYDDFLANTEFTWSQWTITYNSDQRKLMNYAIETNYGGFYNGDIFNVNGSWNYRYQPFGSLGITFDYNDIRLPENFGKEKLFLIGPRLDLTFTDKLFLTTFVQYNDNEDNINLNARFQWRFKPASDFFVVYTENYLPTPIASKNRALVLKLTYWFNL